MCHQPRPFATAPGLCWNGLGSFSHVVALAVGVTSWQDPRVWNTRDKLQEYCLELSCLAKDPGGGPWPSMPAVLAMWPLRDSQGW